MNQALFIGRARATILAAMASGTLVLSASGQNAVAEGTAVGGDSAVPNERIVEPIRRDSAPDRSESSSGQFIVYGEDWNLRGDFCLLAEEVKSEFVRLMGAKDAWKFQVVIQVKGEPGGLNAGTPVRSKISPVENTFRFIVRVEVGDKLERQAIRDELLNVLIYEYILRNRELVGETRAALSVPDWLRRGLGGAIEFRSAGEGRRALFGAIFRSGRILPIPEVMRGARESATSVENAIYDASACALVLTLLSQPNGTETMRRLMADLLVFDGSDYAVIKKYYPDLSQSSNSLEKWWALQIAILAEPSILDKMTVAETETALQRALLIRMLPESAPGSEDSSASKRRPLFTLGKGREASLPVAGDTPTMLEVEIYELNDFEKFVRRKDREPGIEAARLRLMAAGFRAFPIYRPIISEYDAILDDLIKGKRRGMGERLATLGDLRLELLKIARDTEDYLHWYEATQEERPSGVFEEYRNLVEQLHRDREAREDSLSRYLDTMEQEWR